MADSTEHVKQIAVTGCGWVTPFAAGPWDDVIKFAAQHGGVERQEPFAAIPEDFRDRIQRMPAEFKRDRGGWIAALAVEQAIKSAGLELSALASADVGFMLGSALTGLDGMIVFAEEVRKQSPRFVSPLHFPQTVGNYVAGGIARGYGVRGPNATFAGGVASGAQSIVEAIGALRAGRARMIVAGGWEVLTEPLARGLSDVTAPKAEGACFFVLETVDALQRRGGNPLVVTSNDADTAADRFSAIESKEPGDIRMDHWSGWSGAAGGAAAVLGGVAALQSYPVPVVGSAGPDSITIDPLRGVESVQVRFGTGDSGASSLKLKLYRR